MRDDGTIELDKAIGMLPPGEYVHTFRNPAGMFIGADIARDRLLKMMKEHKVKLSGPSATAMKHGLVLHDGSFLFIETVAPQTEAGKD